MVFHLRSSRPSGPRWGAGRADRGTQPSGDDTRNGKLHQCDLASQRARRTTAPASDMTAETVSPRPNTPMWERRRALLAIGAEHVASDEEALLDLLVRALEAAVLVLDDAVAVEAMAVQLREHAAPV